LLATLKFISEKILALILPYVPLFVYAKSQFL